jgi:VCBS repeat protein
VPRKVAVILLGALALVLGIAAVALAGFDPATSYPTGDTGTLAESLDVAIGDFSGDGKPDLAVSNRGDNNVSILRGDGSGKFGAAHNYKAGSMPLGLVVGDWNGDGREDLAAANQSDIGGVTVMLNNGSGFSKHHYPAGTGSSYVLAARFTADQRPDLAVSNSRASTVSILRGMADGKFAKIGDIATSPDPFGLAVSDFNHDGKRDVAVIDTRRNDKTKVQVFRGNGDGTFKAPLDIFVGQGANQMAVGRINGDSIPDLAVADFSLDEVDVLIGNGNGTFRTPKAFPAGSNPADVALGDFNGDGKIDLAVTGDDTPGRLSVLMRKPGLAFSAPIPYPVGDFAYGVAAARLNGDDKPDIATANFSGSSSVLLGN